MEQSEIVKFNKSEIFSLLIIFFTNVLYRESTGISSLVSQMYFTEPLVFHPSFIHKKTKTKRT